MSTPSPLVLSLFPGIGLLDRAFEEEGFCVVRGPDVLWGGDIHRFHPSPAAFDGIIGGPPCQTFSALASLARAQGHEMTFGNLIPEFERVVAEAEPDWFVMENVPKAPEPIVPGFAVHSQLLNNRWLGEEQNRLRRFAFGVSGDRPLRFPIETTALETALYAPAVIAGGGQPPDTSFRNARRKAKPPTVTTDHTVPRSARQWNGPAPTVTSSVGGRSSKRDNARTFAPGAVTSSDGGASKKMWRYTLEEACALQGVPEDMAALYIKHAPFRADAKLKAIANGVPLPMGRAIARAVKRVLYEEPDEASA